MSDYIKRESAISIVETGYYGKLKLGAPIEEVSE